MSLIEWTVRTEFVKQILLLVGTKLEIIIMEMAQRIQDRTTVVKGAPVVEPSNKYFWFNRPDWILFLIHFTLFQVINPLNL
jgi:mlo protein